MIPALAGLTVEPSSTALFFDFDGTLAPIVEDPASSRPAPGACELLARLADRYRTVAVVSGRPISFLAPLLPDTVTISGQYGLELRRPGETPRSVIGDEWTEAMNHAVAALEVNRPAGVLVEPKGLTLTVHHRSAPEAEGWVRERTSAVANQLGLVTHDAKMSVELRPPIERDKGSVVAELAGDATALLYAGDDVGDLPALRFVASSTDAVGTRRGVTVIVASDETDPAVRSVADLTVESPTALVRLLAPLSEST